MFWWGCWEDRALAYIPRLKTGIVPHKKGFWGAATTTPCFVSRRIITSLSCFSRKKRISGAHSWLPTLRERTISSLYYRHWAEFYFGSILVAGGITVYMMFFFTLWDQNSFFQCIFSKKRFFKSSCCLDMLLEFLEKSLNKI